MRMTLAVRPSRPRAAQLSSRRRGRDFLAACLVLRLLHPVLDDALVDRVLLMSELPVVAFFQGVEQIGGAVGLAVVFDLLVAARLTSVPSSSVNT